MPLHHALLSLLAEGESYGYELKGAFDRTVGPQWGALNIGHLYQLLERLKRDGLVAVVREEPQPRRPDRVIYAITDAGREELRVWVQTPSPPAGGYRDDLYLKLVAAARESGDALAAVVRRERAVLLGELHALRALTADADPLAALLTEGAALQVQARLRVLDVAEEQAAPIAAAARRSAAEAPADTARRERAAGE